MIISGGGTGGHIFPAISIANAIRELRPKADILFVGAEGRMEMERVPAAGYPIEGLPITGFNRKHLLRNVGVMFKILQSERKARKIISEFRPQVAVGVGGFASGPTLRVAAKMGVPTLLQEQNSYAGITNKLLSKGAQKICVAYEGMERFFPAEKLVFTGNPIRQDLLRPTLNRAEALLSFGLEADKKTVLLLGGSLGAKTINESVFDALTLIRQRRDLQFIWQTGSRYSDEIVARLSVDGRPSNLVVKDFISNMNVAYAAADLVISRAGAGSISEFCALGKAAILVPSPNVAEDHQTKNAMALVEQGAAVCVRDAEAVRTLIPTAINMASDEALLADLSAHIGRLARPDAAKKIAEEVIALSECGE